MEKHEIELQLTVGESEEMEFTFELLESRSMMLADDEGGICTSTSTSCECTSSSSSCC